LLLPRETHALQARIAYLCNARSCIILPAATQSRRRDQCGDNGMPFLPWTKLTWNKARPCARAHGWRGATTGIASAGGVAWALVLLLGACAAPPRPSLPSPPAGFSGGGVEPGWSVKIDKGEAPCVRIDLYDGARRLQVCPMYPLADGRVGFRGNAPDGRPVEIVIERGSCSDTMSDLDYPNHVRLVMDGRTFTGCGTFDGEAAVLPPGGTL
jgi:uncharacterized membrane protein